MENSTAFMMLFSTDKKRHPNIGAAYGKQWERINKIREVLKLKRLVFREYIEDDIRGNTINAFNLDEEDASIIKGVKYRSKDNTYQVYTNKRDDSALLIGRNGKRINVAQHLLQASIDVDIVQDSNNEV